MGTLDDLMLAAGVHNAPAWFSQVKLPNWPFPHQMEALKDYVTHTRFMDASEPGTGKTFPAQIHSVLMSSLGDNKVVFTMPPKLLRQFETEFHDFFQGIGEHLVIDRLEGSGMQIAKKIKAYDEQGHWPDVLLISYDRFRRLNNRQKKRRVGWPQWKRRDPETGECNLPYWQQDEEGKLIKKAVEIGATPYTKEGQRVNTKGLADNPEQMMLKRKGYNVYFFDEAHRLCNPSSQAFKSCQAMDHEMGEDVAMYLMTGTPVPTHLHDVYGLIRLINPGAYQNKAQFMRRHVRVNKDVKYLMVLGYKKKDEIYQKLYANARRVQKRDVFKDLKEPIISSIPVQLSGPHKKLYDQIIRDRFALLGDQVLAPDNDSALRQLALQVISCPNEFDPTGKLSMENELTEACDTLIDSIGPGEHKIILFAHFKKTVKFLADRYAEWNPAVVNGATSKGWQEIERFKTDDSCRILVVNWASGGEGLNLQVASHLIFYECPTSPKDAKQAIARADRSGQTEIVNAYFFRVLATLYDRNFKNLIKNEEENNEVVRDEHDLLYRQLGVGRKAA